MGSNYRDFDTLKVTSAACAILSRSGYPNDFFALDDDNDASSSDHIVDLKFVSNLTYPSGSSISAIHYGFYFGNGNITIAPQLRDYSSYLAGG